MAGIVAHTRLLLRAKALYGGRELKRLERLLRRVPKHELERDPELFILLAYALSYQTRYEEAKAYLLEGKDAIYSTNDELLVFRWNMAYAYQIIHEGSVFEAKQLNEECLTIAERSQNPRFIAYCTNTLGIIAAMQGELPAGIRYLTRAASSGQQIGDRQMVAASHFNLGNLYRDWGRYEAAANHYALANDFYSTGGIFEESVYMAAERALLYAALGDTTLAERMARNALARARELPSAITLANASMALGSVLAIAGRLSEAKDHLVKALSKAQMTKYTYLKAEVHEELAALARYNEDLEQTMVHALHAKRYYRELGAEKHCERLDYRLEETSLKKSGVW